MMKCDLDGKWVNIDKSMFQILEAKKKKKMGEWWDFCNLIFSLANAIDNIAIWPEAHS